MKEFLVSLAMMSSGAQAADLAGHYYLQNVREVGSELVLKSDGTFEYMLAYGAADYWAKGTWRAADGAAILESTVGEPKPPFRLVRSSAQQIPGVRVFVHAANGRPVPNIDVALIDGEPVGQARTDSDGAAMFPVKRARAAAFRIRVYSFESDPIPLNPDHNEFYFEINGDAITQVRFHGERLSRDGNALVMRFWGDPPMRYVKE